jgi:hypothetical protein
MRNLFYGKENDYPFFPFIDCMVHATVHHGPKNGSPLGTEYYHSRLTGIYLQETVVSPYGKCTPWFVNYMLHVMTFRKNCQSPLINLPGICIFIL